MKLSAIRRRGVRPRIGERLEACAFLADQIVGRDLQHLGLRRVQAEHRATPLYDLGNESATRNIAVKSALIKFYLTSRFLRTVMSGIFSEKVGVAARRPELERALD